MLYDLGDQEGFIQHAEFVAAKLKRTGVKQLITVDPHTTYALKVLYPKYTGQSFDVKTYFELVNFNTKNGDRRVTLHDPCFYGRYLELSDVPTKVLANLGIGYNTPPVGLNLFIASSRFDRPIVQLYKATLPFLVLLLFSLLLITYWPGLSLFLPGLTNP